MKKPDNEGHAAHTKDATIRGLQGHIHRPIKIVLLGAGSSFTVNLVSDILRIPDNQGGEIALVDIDAERLAVQKELIAFVIEKLRGDSQWKLSATTQRKEVMADADYLVSCIEVSGEQCVRIDNDIPAKYGIDQCIGDTIGPGGLFKGFRTIPVFLEILKDAEALCPKAMMLNYTNPMSMLCLAAFRTSPIETVGLCHSVQGTTTLLAKRAGVPLEQVQWECAGINHLAWVTKFEHQGKDLYPTLMQQARELFAGTFEETHGDADKVRKDMMLHFGAFITESSGHLSEYLPYYRKRKDLLEKYMGEGYDGESSFYSNNWLEWREKREADKDAYLSGEKSLNEKRSWEYASWIIEAREKDTPFRIHGNVYNRAKDHNQSGALITNLPADACVEVACFVDRNGINPKRYGALPPQMAAISGSNLSVFDLGAQACIEKSIEKAIHAMMLDPLTAAVLSPAEIKKMTLEMFEAEKEFLPGWQ